MELARQLNWLAQGQGFDQWGDILVLVVMAILWLAGGLAKVLSGRKGAPQQNQQERQASQQARKRETWQERLARKAEEIRRAAQAAARQAEQQTRGGDQPAPSSSPAGRITIRTDQQGDSVMVYERPAEQSDKEREEQAARQREARRVALAARRQAAKAPQIGTPSPASEPVIEGMTAAMGGPPRPLDPAVAEAATLHESGAGFHPAAILDYSDPDALQKAILHYEILGKPLALREPSDETISF
jgi:outer membrane murein-binding lipoprotein Lpp